MTTVLWLLAVQGAIGAFDTLWFHEWRAHLPGGGEVARPELALHAVRAALYAVLFGTLPWVAWHGALAIVLALLLLAEIVVTLTDFAIEDRVRRTIGGVFVGERVTHAVMGIVYGAMLANLVPLVVRWSAERTGFARLDGPPMALRILLTSMAIGVGMSAARDGLAAWGSGTRVRWPWQSWT